MGEVPLHTNLVRIPLFRCKAEKIEVHSQTANLRVGSRPELS